MSLEESSILINKILVEMYQLKANKLKTLQLQDFNIDVIKKIDKNKTKTKTAEDDLISKLKTNNEAVFFKDKATLSRFALKRRAKKIFKLQKRIEKGYISAIDKCIIIVKKIYSSYLKED